MFVEGGTLLPFKDYRRAVRSGQIDIYQNDEHKHDLLQRQFYDHNGL